MRVCARKRLESFTQLLSNGTNFTFDKGSGGYAFPAGGKRDSLTEIRYEGRYVTGMTFELFKFRFYPSLARVRASTYTHTCTHAYTHTLTQVYICSVDKNEAPYWEGIIGFKAIEVRAWQDKFGQIRFYARAHEYLE